MMMMMMMMLKILTNKDHEDTHAPSHSGKTSSASLIMMTITSLVISEMNYYKYRNYYNY